MATRAASRKPQAIATVTKLPPSSPRRAPRKRKPASAPPSVGSMPVNASDIEKHVYGMEIEHVQCRDFGHSWRPYSARVVPESNMIREELRCARCTTIRTRHLGMRGQLLESKYDYVEGYTVKGMGRLSGADRDVIRLASVRYLLKADTVVE